MNIDFNKYTKVIPCGNGYFAWHAEKQIVYQISSIKVYKIPAKDVPNLVQWITKKDQPYAPDHS